jgi:uncharacterized protein with PQ loop repeat
VDSLHNFVAIAFAIFVAIAFAFVLWSIFGSLKSCNDTQRTTHTDISTEIGQKSHQMFFDI